MDQKRANYLFRLIFVAFIVWASVKTILSAPQIAASGDAGVHFLYALAGTEIIAALGFLIVRIERWAGTLLLLVFAVASLHEILAREAPINLIFYATTVLWLLYLSESAPDRKADEQRR